MPLGHIDLFLVALSSTSVQPAMTTSAEDGAFHFDAVAPGRYVVLQEPEWEAYAKRRVVGNVNLSRRTVTVSPSHAAMLTVTLNVGTILEGRVTGGPDNDPVGGISVVPMRLLNSDGLERGIPGNSATTWPDGAYQLTGVSGDKILLQAMPASASASGGLAAIFYPASPRQETATPIEGPDGEQLLEGLAIRVRQTALFSIRGVIVNPNQGDSYNIFIERGLDVSTLRIVPVSPAKFLLHR